MYRILILGIILAGVYPSTSAMGKAQNQCPNIKMMEPQGVAMFGNTVEFRIESDLQNPKDIQVEWTVSSGTIEIGQGTPGIVVRSISEPKIHTIFAKAIVKGLPNECLSVYEGSAIVGCCIDPVIIDEFGKLPVNDQKGRFDNALEELRNNPNNTGLFILRSVKGTTEMQLLKRVKFIKDFVFGYRKFPANRIVIASDPHPSFDSSVKIYRIPPDVEVHLFCEDCRFY